MNALHMTGRSGAIDSLTATEHALGSTIAVCFRRQYAAASRIRGECAMQGLPDRLGDWILSIIERLVPSAVGFERLQAA